ncbi:alkaline phosphatase family protein [Mucilaginibacter sabulilitoris]|uniref:Alkaline phosphatase family protein n=1 Tax=Mucilaginibacter sabulilitoris TaxID=1173583 RepID=A0ABZ0TKK7_9SPHI|nr:alkaline phosphatase family protein [Mucilaginibacter sabulilitoris]WPU93354.1 alkaline phosphatase family protein [Mucilaginibacter sabulilitoris]
MKKIILTLMLAGTFSVLFAQQHKTENVIIVTIDGLRWQEVFRGADSVLIDSKETNDKEEVRKNYWASSADERRKMLMPFFWSALVQQGQLYGNRDKGSKDEVANPYHFSYPGYNEIMTGFPDPRMNTNDAITNPNMNVLEFLNKQKGFEHKVAAFSSWERFTQILNTPRSGIINNSGYMKLTVPGINDRLTFLNEIQNEGPHFLGDSTRIDYLTFEFAKTYMKQFKPRAFYVAFDEPDDMAHAGNYKFYLDRIRQEDDYIKQLWQFVQTDPAYKNKTTLIVTCDHGRGDEPFIKWRDHGKDVLHSEQTWFAVLGPDTPASGEMKSDVTTYHKQLAQTIAKLLGFDFKAAAGHEVGDAIGSVMGK